MVMMTPLEMALESRLESAGFPLGERELLHVKAVDEFLSKMAVPDSRYDEVKDPRLRQILLANRERDIDWNDYLVRRESRRTSAGFYVVYGVFPSFANVDALSNIREYERLEEAIDGFIASRSFWNEHIQVSRDEMYGSESGITQEMVDGLQSRALQKEDFEEFLVGLHQQFLDTVHSVDWDRVDPDDFEGLEITFYGSNPAYGSFGHHELSLGKDVPQDLFEGLVSPVKDALAYAQRVCDYLVAAR